MAIRTLFEHGVRMATHFFVNLTFLNLCGSIVADPIIHRLVPSPFRFEIWQWHDV